MQRVVFAIVRVLPAMLGVGTSFVDAVSPYLQLIALVLGIALSIVSFLVKFEDWKIKRRKRLLDQEKKDE